MLTTAQAHLDYLSRFLHRNHLSEVSKVVEVFHAVRRIPYGSRGGRTAEAVLENNEGSCSGKHILLCELLQRLKQDAFVVTVRGDFTSKIQALDSMPDELKDICEEGGVTDFHQYVIWNSPDGALKLDATWSDGPIRQGLIGNMNWVGNCDTELALYPNEILNRVDDLPAYKAKLLAGLSKGDQQRRVDFLTLLTAWVATTEEEGSTL
jgi:hypothetical protein